MGETRCAFTNEFPPLLHCSSSILNLDPRREDAGGDSKGGEKLRAITRSFISEKICDRPLAELNHFF